MSLFLKPFLIEIAERTITRALLPIDYCPEIELLISPQSIEIVNSAINSRNWAIGEFSWTTLIDKWQDMWFHIETCEFTCKFTQLSWLCNGPLLSSCPSFQTWCQWPWNSFGKVFSCHAGAVPALLKCAKCWHTHCSAACNHLDWLLLCQSWHLWRLGWTVR